MHLPPKEALPFFASVADGQELDQAARGNVNGKRNKAAGEALPPSKLLTGLNTARAYGLRAQVMSSPLYRRPLPQWRSTMRISNWLRPLMARLSPARARRTPRRPASRPRVEALEDRTTPTAVQLINLSFAVGPHYLT